MEEKTIQQTTTDVSNNDATKEYKEERFEFALYINNNLICKRNFRMFNFIEGSLQSEDFDFTMDSIVRMIDDDLKSKSRVYTWLYGNEYPTEEFTKDRPEPWEYTFMLTMTDNKNDDKHVVYSKIWDGSGYPAIVRNNVDLTNSTLKFVKKDGEVLVFDAETYFEEYKDSLSPEAYVKKCMMGDKENLLPIISKTICETCSPYNNSPYTKLSDYTTKVTYGNGKNSKTYDLNINRANDKYFQAWGKSLEEKTKAYFDNLY